VLVLTPLLPADGVLPYYHLTVTHLAFRSFPPTTTYSSEVATLRIEVIPLPRSWSVLVPDVPLAVRDAAPIWLGSTRAIRNAFCTISLYPARHTRIYASSCASWRIFSRCSPFSQHTPVHCFASWAHLVWPCLIFGCGPRACISCSPIRFPLPRSSLYFHSDSLDYSARAHSLSAKSARCQSLPDYLLQIHESLSPSFSILLTPYICLSYLVRSPIPCHQT